MWHQHILDVTNYVHDTILLCGHVVGHNPDGGAISENSVLERAARRKTTREALISRFGSSGFDYDVWDFSKGVGEEKRLDRVREIMAKTNTIHYTPSGNSEPGDGNDIVVIMNIVGASGNNSKQPIRFDSRVKMSIIFDWYFSSVYPGKGSGNDIEIKRDSRYPFHNRDPTFHNLDQNAKQLGLKYGEEVQIIDKTQTVVVRVNGCPTLFHKPLQFKLSMVTPLWRLFETVTKMLKMKSSELRFTLDGERIEDQATLAMLEFQDTDEIYVWKEQGGC